MIFKHYILTRYNLGIYNQSNPYAEKVGNPKEWMTHRETLFNRCAKSIQQQTKSDFTWLIALDEQTDKETIEKILSRKIDIKIIHEQPHVWLRKQTPEAEWLITSRIDNDDVFHPEFIETIQNNFRNVEEIIDIDYEVIDIKTGIKYPSLRTRANSPFLSLAEIWGNNVMTAMGKAHSIMPEYYNSRKLGILAIQIIHDRNILNKTP